MKEIVAIDIGGTNARFALAKISSGRVRELGEPVVLETAAHVSFPSAWQAFVRQLGRDAPKAAAIAVAGPADRDVIEFTNNPWTIRRHVLSEQIDVDDFSIINDFEAVAHSVGQLGPECFEYLSGPAADLPSDGVITVIGPGTGLGVAYVLRDAGGYEVRPTEGGHIDFAPLDPIEDAMLARMRLRYRRVSAERIVSGPGIVEIHQALAMVEGTAITPADDRTIWHMGLSRSDRLAEAAVERFCRSLGSVAGDIALAQGAHAVVIAGGLGLRLKDRLAQSGFAERFRAKGRFADMMAGMPVKLIVHPQPGLYGAAAAYAREHP